MTLKSFEEYGRDFQLKVISSLLTDKKFLLNIYESLDEDIFPNQSHKWIVKEIIKYYQKYHTNPSMDVIKVEMKKIDNEVLQLAIKEELREAYRYSDKDTKYVQEEFSQFCKNQVLKKVLLQCPELIKVGDYETIETLIKSAMKTGQDKNIGHEYNKDIESRYREDYRKVVPTPWNSVNDLVQGGLGNGDLALFFGSPGGGKSWMMVALAGHAVKAGYNVIYYTLELSEDYVGKRFDAYFTNTPVDKLKDHRDKVESVIAELPGKLIVKEFPMGKTTLSSIEAHYEKTKSQLEEDVDLIIIDYLDLLSTKKKVSDPKFEIDDIYRSTKGLARVINVPIASPSQVNRAGAKDDIIEGDKAAGSYDKMMIADFAGSLSRKKEDKVNGTGRFHVMKNRYGIDGLTFNVKIDTNTGHINLLDEWDEDEVKSSSDNQKPLLNEEWANVDKSKLRDEFFKLNT